MIAPFWWISRDGGHDIDGEWEPSFPPSLSGPLTGTGLRLRVYSASRKGKARGYRYARWSAEYLSARGAGVCRSAADASRKAVAWWRAHRAAAFTASTAGWSRLLRWDNEAQRWVGIASVDSGWGYLQEHIGKIDGGVYAVVKPDGDVSYFELDWHSLCGCERGPGGAAPVLRVPDWRRGEYWVFLPPVGSQHDLAARAVHLPAA